MSDSSRNGELSNGWAALLDAAREARRYAFVPYSEHPVGAALLDADGEIHRGVNVENASYGLTTCAERSAAVCAIGKGVRAFRAIAIVGPDDAAPCMPCGACRQILHELAPDLLVVVHGEGGEPSVVPLSALLPAAFDAAALEGGRVAKRGRATH